MFGILFEGLPENALNGGVHCEPSVNWKRSKIDYFPSIGFPQRSWARTTPKSAAAEGGLLDFFVMFHTSTYSYYIQKMAFV